MTKTAWKFCLIVAGLVVVAGCSKSNGYSTAPTNPPPQSTTSIMVGNNYFQPASATVTVGSTVTWTWAGGVSHNVTFDDGVASATQASGTYVRKFSTAGTYRYHCTIHGTMMSGTIIVQ